MTDPAGGTQSPSEEAAPHAADLEIEVELRAGAAHPAKLPPRSAEADREVPPETDSDTNDGRGES
jgi:hypothetical protein